MRVLITGGNGFLARNLCEVLAALGHDISAPSRDLLDCTSLISLQNYLKSNKFDIVIHAAGKVGSIKDNISNSDKYFFYNAQMGMNVLNSCLENNIKNLLNIGSINSFPVNENQYLNEDSLLEGSLDKHTEAYGLAKSMVAKYCQYISLKGSFHYKTLHLSNLFGKYDRFEVNPHMIPAIIARIHKAKEINSDYVEIWGEGSARRSFIYATDVCNFIGSIVNDFELFPQDYILTGKNNYSVLEYNKIIAEQIAYKGSFQFNLDKPVGYKKRLICSKHKSYSVFYTPIEQSISEVYEFYLKEVCK
jgi:GDP-L-fucose synthase|tara:strand:+ start:1160 stop:2071 length:912 start_codon:yes stop_codon:yes gene_type:complete